MNQYSKRMVIVHWLTLALLVAAYFLGDSLDAARHHGGANLTGYIVHALVGGAVLLLMLSRLYFRSQDGTPLLDDSLAGRVAKGVHHLLYVLLALLPLSGVMTILKSSVGNALLSGDASLLPTKYTGAGILPHKVHEYLVWLLISVVALHILGALWHQFIKKDGLMERMSLRRNIK